MVAIVSVEGLAADRLRRLALERIPEIIGEAAGKVSPEVKAAHPAIPWRPMTRHRNVLAHEYGDIDHTRLWNVARKDIPLLIDQLEAILPPPPTDSGAPDANA